MTSSDTALPPVPPVSDINASKPRKLAYYESSPVDKLFYSERAVYLLNNDSTTRRIMAPLSYDNEKIARFTKTHQDAAAAQVLQTKEASERIGHYAEFEKQFTLAKGQIYYIAKVAKIAFRKNPDLLDALHISRRKERSISKILDYMDNFYQNALANEKILTGLADYSYPKSVVEQMQTEYLKARTLYNSLSQETADAIQATRVRDEKIKELDEWMYEYYGFLKIAYAQNPNWLAEKQLEEAQLHTEQ